MFTSKRKQVAVVFENARYDAWRFDCDGWRSVNFPSPEKAEEAARKKFPGCEVVRGGDPQARRFGGGGAARPALSLAK